MKTAKRIAKWSLVLTVICCGGLLLAAVMTGEERDEIAKWASE